MARGSSLRRERNLWLAVFLVPPLLLMVVFTLLPALAAIGYSFFNFTSFNREGFVGFGNFAKLGQFPFGEQFLRAFLNVCMVFVALLVVQNGTGLVFAYALWRQPPGFKFFRAVIFFTGYFVFGSGGFFVALAARPDLWTNQ